MYLKWKSHRGYFFCYYLWLVVVCGKEGRDGEMEMGMEEMEEEQMCLLKDCMSRVGEADTPGRLRTLESKILARIASEV